MKIDPGGRGFAAEDVQTIENALADTPTDRRTRRWLLGAALGAGVAGATMPVGKLLAQSGMDSAKKVGTVAVTAEALAVTYLSHLIVKAGGAVPSTVADILKAANTAEQDHYLLLNGAGFKPLTTKFWIPDSALTAKNAPAVIEKLETLFVNAYLIGTTVFSAGGDSKMARYAAEIAGTEAQHRALARDLQGKLPDNLAFEDYTYKNLDAIVGQITALGVGIGKKGKGAGSFYTYSGPLSGTTIGLATNAPDQSVPFPVIGATGQPVMTG